MQNLLAIFVGTLALLAVCKAEKICIVGSGIGGASVSYFLRNYSSKPIEIEIYERGNKVGGRLAQIQLGNDKFEAGGSIIAGQNVHMKHFVEILGLKKADSPDDDNLGIWNGREFIFETVRAGDSYVSKKLTSLWNTILLLWRYGTSLMKMQSHVSELFANWLKLYDENILVFDTVESMLKSVNLYDPTQHTLQEELTVKGFSQQLIDELITVIMRINYGQSVNISGLAGAVSLAGSGDDLWAVEGGNFQVPAGLIKFANASLYLNEEVVSIEFEEGSYKLGLKRNERKNCDAVIIATPLDEETITFSPQLKLPKRSMQHTHTTFVRGLVNPEYFGAKSVSDLPNLIGTMEVLEVPFSCISILKSYSAEDKIYKMFSRTAPTDKLLDQLFRTRTQTQMIDWPAYPHYSAPEQFAPISLDDHHLYYINTFESAASAMEASAVAARNVARLLLSRISGGIVSQVVRHPDYESALEL